MGISLLGMTHAWNVLKGFKQQFRGSYPLFEAVLGAPILFETGSYIEYIGKYRELQGVIMC